VHFYVPRKYFLWIPSPYFKWECFSMPVLAKIKKVIENSPLLAFEPERAKE